MEAEAGVDLRARAIELRQAELDRAAHSSAKEHDTDGLRLKASRLIHSQLLDYRHNSPTHLKKSVSLLLKLCDNIVEHPLEEKYRKVRRIINCWECSAVSMKLMVLLRARACKDKKQAVTLRCGLQRPRSTGVLLHTRPRCSCYRWWDGGPRW
jgi:hypothetical protein